MKKFREFISEGDHTGHVAKRGKHFYVDRENIDTGKEISKPGQKIKFSHKGKTYSGTVSDQAHGRDDDIYKVDVHEELNPDDSTNVRNT